VALNVAGRLVRCKRTVANVTSNDQSINQSIVDLYSA